MFTLIEKGTISSTNLLSIFSKKRIVNICLAMLTFITYLFTSLLVVLAFTMIVMWGLAVVLPETYEWLMGVLNWSGGFTHSRASIVTMAIMQCHPIKDKAEVNRKVIGTFINLRHSEERVYDDDEETDEILRGAKMDIVRYYKLFVNKAIPINKDNLPVLNGVVKRDIKIDMSKFNIVRKQRIYGTGKFDAGSREIMATSVDLILEAKSTHAGLVTMEMVSCRNFVKTIDGKKVDGCVFKLRDTKVLTITGQDELLEGLETSVVKYYTLFVNGKAPLNKDGKIVIDGVVKKDRKINMDKYNVRVKKTTYGTGKYDADSVEIMATSTELILERKKMATTVDQDIEVQADVVKSPEQLEAEQEERDRAAFEAYKANEVKSPEQVQAEKLAQYLTFNEELEKKADLSFKHRIGKHIEDAIREKIRKDLKGFISVKVEDVQGGQDIVIEYNGEKIYYVEVKSRWNTQQSIMMSSLQMKKASENKEIYSLCCVNMSGYTPDKGDRYEPPVEVILDRISVLDDIGEKLEPLHKRIHTKNYNEIHITDDYKVVIPQTVVKQGNDDIQYLMDKIKNIID